MIKRIFLVIAVLLLLLAALILWRSCGPSPSAKREGCAEFANRKVWIWRAMRLSTAEIEKRYQKELALCQGAGRESACLIAEANYDYSRLGRQFLSKTLGPAEYLAAVRDRSRKLRLGRQDSTWAAAICKGDSDGDLVPDDRDQCPDTPDLRPTDDRGCPQTGPLPAAPSPAEIERAKEVMKIAISPACNGASPPSFQAPLRIGSDSNDPDSFLIAVTKANDQPPQCPVFYEIRIRSVRSSFFSQSSGAAHFYFAFRGADNVDTSPEAAFRQVFRVRKQDVPNWVNLVATAIEPSDREDRVVEVRTVNGNGVSRGWGAPRTFSINLVTRAFPPF